MTSVQTLPSHRWRVPAAPFVAATDDGVDLVGTRLGGSDATRPAIVFAHGLMGWHRKPRIARFAELLSDGADVYAFDLRGHGRSGGLCDFGRSEIHDVDAVLRLARDEGHETVATVGTSMGAISVVRQAGLLGGPDAVVAISCLATWDWRETAHPGAREKMDERIRTPTGRALLRAYGVRMVDSWEEPESPLEVVGTIAPAPLLIVHGRDDPLFDVEHARRLYDAAAEPKTLWIGERFGHSEDGLTPAFARRLAGWLGAALGEVASGDASVGQEPA
jgi:pimeloyl-ACP methyl ester carboxylesterase